MKDFIMFAIGGLLIAISFLALVKVMLYIAVHTPEGSWYMARLFAIFLIIAGVLFITTGEVIRLIINILR